MRFAGVRVHGMVCDRALIGMAERRQRDLDAFAEVNGVGGAKLKAFGTIFLSAIAAHQSGQAS